jgi:hypothetical protein
MQRVRLGVTADCPMRDDILEAIVRLHRQGSRPIVLDAVVDEVLRATGKEALHRAMLRAWAVLELSRRRGHG